MKTKFEDRIFWKDGFSFDLNKFIEKIEIEEGKEVVGIQFEGNNIELITKKQVKLSQKEFYS
jgi:hypothetical protein